MSSDEHLTDSQRVAEMVGSMALMFLELRRLKTERPARPRDERVMKPTPGPQAPMNVWALSLDMELTEAVWEIATDVRDSLVDVPRVPLAKDAETCLGYIMANVEGLLRLPHAQDIVESLATVRNELSAVTRPQRMTPAGLVRQERRRPVKEAMAVLHGMGVEVPRGSLWDWEKRGYITTTKSVEGIKLYKVSELLRTWQRITNNGTTN